MRSCTCGRIGCPALGERARALAYGILVNAPAGNAVPGLCVQLLQEWTTWDGCLWRMGLCEGPCSRPCCAPVERSAANRPADDVRAATRRRLAQLHAEDEA
eukprot:12107253-Alexandrium_andersonii.AAC.1